MGLATAQAFAEAGAAVVLADFKEDAVKAAAHDLLAAGHMCRTDAVAYSGLRASVAVTSLPPTHVIRAMGQKRANLRKLRIAR